MTNGTIWKCSDGRARGSVATAVASLAVGVSVLRLVVLAAAPVARFPSGNGGRSTLAMAGGGSVGAGIRGSPALRLGLRMDGTRYACADRSAAAIGRGRFLPLCSQPHVPGLRGGMDWAVGRFRARQPARSPPWQPSPSAYICSCSFMKSRLCAEIRGRLRRVLPERGSLVAACARLGQAIVADWANVPDRKRCFAHS